MSEVSDLLQKWQLMEIGQSFEEHGIDTVDIMLELKDEHIKELIPKLGNRIKFENCRKKFLDEREAIIDSEIFFIDETVSNRLTNTSASTSTSTSTLTLYSSSSNSLDSLVEKDTGTNNFAQSNELRKNLESNLDGLEILASASRNNLSRKKLVNFIINQEFRESIEFRITTARFEELANQIVEIFPGENKETYFIPFHKETNKNCLAKGKLWDKYHNKRRILKEVGLLPTKNKANNPTPSEPDRNVPESTINEETNEKVIWLQHNIAPWTTVEQFWADTSIARNSSFQNSNNTIENIFKLYPPLKQALGYSLIDIDFKNLYPNNCENFLTFWPGVSVKINEIIKIRNGLGNSLLQNYSAASETLSALLVLPYHLNITKIKGHKWRPTKAETANSFCLYLKTQDELLPYLQERREKYERLKITAQPFTIIIGDDLENISASYVSVNDILYIIETPLKAVDICFKIFHVFNAKYPVECEHIWTFLQKYIYKFTTPYDNNYTTVNSLISDINNIQ